MIFLIVIYSINFSSHSFVELSLKTKRVPYFQMFIYCVWLFREEQTLRFEFNEELLLFLLDHAFSSRFGTFLQNSLRDRDRLNLPSKTTSIFSYILHNSTVFTNPDYIPTTEERSFLKPVNRSQNPIFPFSKSCSRFTQ